mmetsp:Transcript_7183/g.22987  ORF Transcript_7183/g.22987 Transcript_7183/m.22987 type:complete len:279 (+) Transcript_7183:450-1286(+)
MPSCVVRNERKGNVSRGAVGVPKMSADMVTPGRVFVWLYRASSALRTDPPCEWVTKCRWRTGTPVSACRSASQAVIDSRSSGARRNAPFCSVLLVLKAAAVSATGIAVIDNMMPVARAVAPTTVATAARATVALVDRRRPSACRYTDRPADATADEARTRVVRRAAAVWLPCTVPLKKWAMAACRSASATVCLPLEHRKTALCGPPPLLSLTALSTWSSSSSASSVLGPFWGSQMFLTISRLSLVTESPSVDKIPLIKMMRVESFICAVMKKKCRRKR